MSANEKVDDNRIELTIEYSDEVIEAFQATGEGWEDRINEVLKIWIREHNLSELKI
ncbi:BrnA antitoxin family protein [Serratia symbiotica]|uniref:BrnA antitoxin family protein n=1 Tax=Serratia symbiotica TaxID=138074 RepID=UPI001888A60D|nr:BrnA antitoxin family protein [Serratia symbiotica]MBF1994417.1 BrnA antitoxin family protein [Serratia symbiotica]